MNNLYGKIEKNLTSKEKFHIKLGTERVSEVLELLENPQNQIKTIHIAGTNGKGSTSAMLAKILEVSNYKTGLFTSPHLLKYNERIKINSEDISDADLQNILEKINETAQKHQIPLTEFEILTITAFLYFAEKKVDIAIIEVGLGGRLDATNVITPLLEIITSISIDHTDRLGDTIEQIAAEKAGIIKPNSIVITNENNAGLKTILGKTQSVNATPILAPNASFCEIKDETNHITIDGITHKIGLLGEFQGENLSLVLEAIKVLEANNFKIKNLKTALEQTFWAARMQLLAPNVILDGAHNPDAAKKLRETLDKNFPNKQIIWFFGALKNKDYETNVKILFKDNEIVNFVKFNLHNSCAEAELARFCGIPKRQIIDISGFLTEYNNVKKDADLVVICGSLYLAGSVLALLVD